MPAEIQDIYTKQGCPPELLYVFGASYLSGREAERAHGEPCPVLEENIIEAEAAGRMARLEI